MFFCKIPKADSLINRKTAGSPYKVISRRIPLVLFLYIGTKEIKVDPHISLASVPQNLLQAENITTVDQVNPGEGMPEGMR